MEDATLKALNASIVKWEANLVAAQEGRFSDIRQTSDDCPLCEMFADKDCEGCPVFEESGESACESTPYTDIPSSWELRVESHSIEEIVPLVQAEVDFLKSLRPAT